MSDMEWLFYYLVVFLCLKSFESKMNKFSQKTIYVGIKVDLICEKSHITADGCSKYTEFRPAGAGRSVAVVNQQSPKEIPLLRAAFSRMSSAGTSLSFPATSSIGTGMTLPPRADIITPNLPSIML